MKNTFGNNVSVTVFGESHSKSIGVVLDGLTAGIEVNEEFINEILALRRPSGTVSTARVEKDEYTIHSGVFNGFTTGTPICITIPNSDTRSQDYAATRNLARPSHADYTAHIKYNGFEDYRGGGHFSGRITAAICAAGALALSSLEKKGVLIGTHIKAIGNVFDRDFEDYENDIKSLKNMQFAALGSDVAEKMHAEILSAKSDGDSIGGILETAVIGIPAGVGEPFFDSIESVISHAVFSIPGVKGIEFGLGFGLCNKRGSEANDPFEIKDGKVVTATNNSGGINGGISNGMPIVFKTAMRPTPTISKDQKTVDFEKMVDAILASRGRHDPCIVHRARVVVDCMVALALCDLLSAQFGKDWLGE